MWQKDSYQKHALEGPQDGFLSLLHLSVFLKGDKGQLFLTSGEGYDEKPTVSVWTQGNTEGTIH